jgi:adenylate cyclase
MGEGSGESFEVIFFLLDQGMAYEIERKFLVKCDGWREGAVAHTIMQGYLAREPHRTVRVRLRDDEAWMTVKGPTTGITRAEVEFPLEREVARDLFALCLDGMIHKTRHEISVGGLLWEVDEFHGANEGLVVAEIELPDEATAFERPPWLGPEVSADGRFSNSMLARRPWTDWSEQERAEIAAMITGD